MNQGLEFILECLQRIEDFFGSLLHNKGSSHASESRSGLVNSGMLHFPEEARQHRNNLVFTPDAFASGAISLVLPCDHMVLVIGHMIGGPGLESLPQGSIHLDYSSSRKDQDPKAYQILKVRQRVLGGSILVERSSLMTPSPEGIHRTLAFFDSGFHDQLLVRFQGVCDGKQVVVDLGLKLSGNAPDFG
jgi:hypothetical protein